MLGLAELRATLIVWCRTERGYMAIEFQTDGAVAIITINRPEAMNAIDRRHNTDLAGAFQRYEHDPSLRAAVVTGAGEKAFSAGADLRDLMPSFREAVRNGERPPWVFGGITQAGFISKPTIAAVNGLAYAGGLELALACDVRIASPHATFALVETKVAVIPGAGGTQRLARTVPLGVALEMILTGEPVNAEDALRWGLVNRVVPAAELVDSAVRMGHIIAQRGPLAVQAARQAVLEGLSVGLSEGLEREHERFIEIVRTDDAAEGNAAFAEKRAPQFFGR